MNAYKVVREAKEWIKFFVECSQWIKKKVHDRYTTTNNTRDNKDWEPSNKDV